MNVLVVSDSHGKVDKLIQAVEQVRPGYVLHLGDCQRDLEKLRQAFPMLPMEGVPGNCDYGSCDQPERLIELGGVRILMLHGHTRGVKSDVMRAVWAARECGAQVLLFGHTHRRELVRGVGTAATVFNPGSLRDGGSYGVITIENGKCSFTWKRVPEF